MFNIICVFKSIRSFFYFIFVILPIISLLSEAAHAMSVSPIVVEMTAAGRGSKSVLRVVNDGKTKLPVEIVVSKIELGPNGEQNKKLGAKDFLIFPPQAIIKPGSTQTFRVQWVGQPDIPKSNTYIFSVNQVPVKMPKGKSGVQLVFNFGAVVNVSPIKGNSSLKLLRTDIGKDAKGKRKPAVTVSNSGNIHARLSDATIKLSGNGWSKTLNPGLLKQSLGVGLVQPGKKRRLLLPVELPANVTKVAATIQYKGIKK